MHRKVLLAEQVDATRTVAEAILRKNGFEVIAVTAAEKAREVLELSRPDLIIVGADLLSPDGTPFYSRLRADANWAAIPLLLFNTSDQSAVDAAPESIIPTPLVPHEFMQRVSQAVPKVEKSGAALSTPLQSVDVDDDFLDAALGLDQIDVTDSEVMDQTPRGLRYKKTKSGDRVIDDETNEHLNDSDTSIPAVESLILEEDASRIHPRTPRRIEPPKEGTGKLDILSDQFGMIAKAEDGLDQGDGVHDYDWFVDAVREDVQGDPARDQAPSGSGKLHITENASAVNPVTPGPVTPSQPKQSGSVEEFIDEFKREMEMLNLDEGETAIAQQTLAEVKAPPSEEAASLAWEDKMEQIGPAQVDLFTREFARHLADKVAAMIAAKIDPEKLLKLIRTELGEWQKNR